MTKLGTTLAAALFAMSLSACGGGTSPGGSPSADQILVNITPSTASVPTTQGKNFHATVINDLAFKGVRWELSGTGCTGDGCGTLSNATTDSVTYIAPSTPPVPAVVTLTSTAIADPTKSAAVKVFVFTPGTISISVTPSESDVDVGTTVQLTAALANDVANAGVTWKVAGGCGILAPNCGTVFPAATASGVPTTYTAPRGVVYISSPAPVRITASSATDPSVSASAVVNLRCVPGQCSYF